MSTERFSRSEFENALPVDKDTGEALWEYVGFEKGEHVYMMPIKNGEIKRVAIMIRSSVKKDGYAAGTGNDSIRLWLVNSKTGKPLGKKVDAYTQRTTGWQKRMNDKLRQLYERGLHMYNCPKCSSGVMLERNGKYGKFYGCSNFPRCRHTMNSLPVTQPESKDDLEEDLLEEVLSEPQEETNVQWSQYQTAIFDFIENGQGNAVVEAVPGSGKTTTIVEGLNHTPDNASVIFIAFNKRIVRELEGRIGNQYEVRTFHSLGFKNERAAFGRIKVDNSKTYWILKDWLEECNDKRFKSIVGANKPSVLRLVSLCKATMLEPTFDNLEYLADNYNVNVNGDHKEIFEMAKIVFDMSIQETWRIDFDDMIYFCASQMVTCEKFDYIFVDEAQDLNKAQIQFLLNMMHKDSRVIAVGDRFQSIYGFRGADTQAIPNLIEALGATQLPLSITYRCPKSHVELAQGLVPHIEAWEKAKEGIIETVSNQDFLQTVKEGDMVLCRTNAPLVSPALRLIRNGIKAVVLGRDIGKGLINLIEKIEKRDKVESVYNLLYNLEDYMYTELKKFLSTGKYGKAQNLEDQVATINVLSDGCNSIAELKDRIKQVFSDDAKGVTFSSVHKAKGLESERVFILHPELMPHPMAMQSENPEALQQERNIELVAKTRSKSELYFVK
ncbi:AAA family ATPase [bacterium]|nr:AAA family ATPase [bacterium]